MFRKFKDLLKCYINCFLLVNNVYEFEDGWNILILFKIKVIYIFNLNKNCILIILFVVLWYLSNVIKMCIWCYKIVFCMW